MISRASEISDKGVAPSNNATICCLRPDHYHHHHHHHHGNPNPSRDYCGNFKVSWLFSGLRVIIWCRDKSRKINKKSEEKTKKKVFLWCGRASAVRGMQSFRPIIYLVGPIHHWRSYWAPGQQLLFTCPTTNQPAQPDTNFQYISSLFEQNSSISKSGAQPAQPDTDLQCISSFWTAHCCYAM